MNNHSRFDYEFVQDLQEGSQYERKDLMRKGELGVEFHAH